MDDTETVAPPPATETVTPPPATPPPAVATTDLAQASAEADAQLAAARARLAEAQQLQVDAAALSAAAAATNAQQGDATLARLQLLEAEIATRNRQQQTDARWVQLQSMGTTMTRAQAAEWTPAYDVSTPEGLAQLDEWRDANANQFSAPTQSVQAIQQRVTQALPTGNTSKMWGDDFATAFVGGVFAPAEAE